MSTTAYPVHVEAQLDAGLSRWLWLVKWLLALPHYVVLGFLWLAFAVTSVIAFFGILFTGRYPHALFDFNVGVLRWSWRVAYYTYGALGTDRYPPFTLHERPDYPAHLEVDYPEHLSRGLVLVKWWLLAIPHYIVVGLFLGGADYAARTGDHAPGGRPGLIGILVLVAGVLLLVTGRYPERLFALVLGLNRWVLRVAGYVGLMTDRYPPFALDQGGHEDAGLLTSPPPRAPAPAPPTDPDEPARASRPGWTGGRVVSLVLGSVLTVVALGLAGAGAALTAADLAARDADGFVMTPTGSVKSSGYAVTTSSLRVESDVPGVFVPHALLGEAKVRARTSGGGELFIGIAPTERVAQYLDGARHSVVRRFHGGRATYEETGTGTLGAPPTSVDIWTRQDSGPGTLALTWPVQEGAWTVVVMNADGSPGVAAEAAVGAELPALHGLVIGLFATAAVAALVAVALILGAVGAVTRSRREGES